MVKEDIVIQSANISYLNEILSIIMDIDDKRNNIMKYNDFEFKHSENSLEEVLNNKNKNEIIFIARHKEKLIGMINILFSNPNYIFFVDKFAYVKYLYVEKSELVSEEERKDISEKLFNIAMEKIKKYGFRYICGDILDGDDDLKELFQINCMKKYRSRLYKKINDV